MDIDHQGESNGHANGENEQQHASTATTGAYSSVGQGEDTPPRSDVDEILRRKRKAR